PAGCDGGANGLFSDDGDVGDDAGMGDQPDLADEPPADLYGIDQAGADLITPITGTVSAKGGSVSRLLFGFTGDARPATCDDVKGYPTAIITSIFKHMAAANVQFGIDLGDHVFVCSGNQTSANNQMDIYMHAAAQL